ncbi:hypothetical protein ISF_03567 [Cordyceps fumosorosea ARSEF 2679]|uniref:C6 zinc finger domain protein n=1 Tax=Cordyceps fumosorosea (strain ARSEF 2679) TaxID=1081104 RepID=A0A167ZDY4_CORFA|nr:hypothetical protein ISF_03567 [Cordyceps fumosorosea ARSEF 2679]OAA67391.1 hypothetical protein ISF_03567 [Cordyceps fumosorosea ARSEF 2679]
MVFSGRPSTACHACRPVRRKVSPSLMQTLPITQASGNETNPSPASATAHLNVAPSVVAKATTAWAIQTPLLYPRRKRTIIIPLSFYSEANSAFSLLSLTTLDSSYSSSSSSSSSCSSAITRPLHLSTNQQALSFLFHAFISATPFDGYLASFYTPRTAADADDACAWAIDAVALAAYGRHTRQPGCADVARTKYAGTLTRVNDALADPDGAALRDRTLVAVLVLALFEATAFFHPASTPTSWVAHTWGARQLLMLRGPRRCTASPAARRLFSHTSNNVKASCIQRSAPIPSAFLALDAEVRGLLDGQDPAARLAHFLHAVSALKARSNRTRASGLVADPSSLKDYACHHMADVAVGVLATVPSFVYKENGRRTFMPPGRCLGWPLGILEMGTVCPPDPRLYARKTLEWLAEDLNLPQAIGPDRHPGSREDWLHLFHLG